MVNTKDKQVYLATKKLSEKTEQNSSEPQPYWNKQVYVKTKKLSEKTEKNSREPQPFWSNNILGSSSFSNSFWSISVRGHSHIQVASRNVQWAFMGGYLNYMYVFVCGNCLAKTYFFYLQYVSWQCPNFFLPNICNGTSKRI